MNNYLCSDIFDQEWGLFLSSLLISFLAFSLTSSTVIIIVVIIIDGSCLVVLSDVSRGCGAFRATLIVVQCQFLTEIYSRCRNSILVASSLLLPRADFFHLESLDRVFNISHVAGWRPEVLGTAFACNFEPKDLGLVMINLGRQNDGHWIVHQEHLREASAEAGTIYVDLSSFRQVNLFASWAEVLEARCFKGVA